MVEKKAHFSQITADKLSSPFGPKDRSVAFQGDLGPDLTIVVGPKRAYNFSGRGAFLSHGEDDTDSKLENLERRVAGNPSVKHHFEKLRDEITKERGARLPYIEALLDSIRHQSPDIADATLEWIESAGLGSRISRVGRRHKRAAIR